MTKDSTKPKENALRALGITSRRADRWLWTITDVVEVDVGRCLLRIGEQMRSLVLGVSGTVTLVKGEHSATATNTFVLDTWCCDDRWASLIEVTTASKATLVVVNLEHRDALYHRLPTLRRRSLATSGLLIPAPAGEKMRSRTECARSEGPDAMGASLAVSTEGQPQ